MKSGLSRVFLLGLLLALLAYLFHPGAGHFQVTWNGVPVADPLVRIGAIPAVLVVMVCTGILTLCVFFGVGLILLLVASIALILGSLFILPYFWPLLLIVLLAVIIMASAGGADKTPR